MMKNKLILGVLSIFMLFLSLNAKAQGENDWKWGDDPQRAKEQYTLFSDYVRSKDYTNALEPMEWLLENTPDLSKTLYQKAFTTYTELVNTEKDAAKKTELEDKALGILDKRIEIYGEKEEVVNRKGYYALTYRIDRQSNDNYRDLYRLYKEIVDLNKENTFRLNVINFMYMVNIIKGNDMKDKEGNLILTEEDVMEIHENLSGIIEKNVAKGQEVAEWNKAQEDIDGYFSQLVTMDCAFINSKMIPKLEGTSGEERLTMINDILARMIKAKCLKEPKFLELSKELAATEPTFSRVSFLYKAYLGKDDLENATLYINKAIELAENDKDKADVTITRAKLKRKQGAYGAARADYMSALKYDASKAYEAYTAIGDMYLSSGNACNGTDASNPVHKKAIYIAAYNYYVKAGNSAKAATAQRYFPSKEEIFTHSMGGQQVNTGCWVGETVTIPSL